MPATQLTLAASPHYNRRLFSDHYLNSVLPDTGEWRLGRDGAAALLPQVQALFQSFVPSPNEAQTENDLIRPVLSLLGHDFEVQAALKTADGTKKPDYFLYRDAAALLANKGRVLTDADLVGALAVADAKHWDRPLDQAMRLGSDPFTNKNPGYQISFYVQQSGLPWGILTNGRLWRLYHRDTAHKLDVYYEVDLAELVQAADAERFQYFLRFFERSAFDEGPLSLRRYLSESESYSRNVGEGLREQVYDALLHVAQGFLDFPRNGLSPEPATLKAIYDNSLILLYRLLFVLYAEARGLLPVEESPQYRDRYSLHAIKRDVAEDVKYGRSLVRDQCTLWFRLTALFDIINRGNPPLKVATFNGGLFDPARHQFLEQYSVGDARLQQAIDKLARVDGEFVDYRDLAERHLGTIYEGLLEFQLRPLELDGTAAPEDRAAAGEGWTVKLVTDRGERKATGSYYTPGFVTRFMVERAVGPVVDRALERTAAAGPEAQVQAVLNVNVLDCAMGSGHFLVEATDYLARRLVEADLLPPELRSPASLPGSPALPLSPSRTPSIDELAYWKRRVAQSCVYGVDLNPLAVDLAKLSLWLATAAKDRPLSFLDHHLRPGNALVGARLDELTGAASAPVKKRTAARKVREAEESGQLTWAADSAFTQSMKLAVDNMWLIEESAAATVEDVKEQERLYESAREAFIRKYSRLADLVTAMRFGLEVDEGLRGPLADYATGRTIMPLPQFKQWTEQAEALAEQHRFFHWELEFPEVFFDRFGRPLGDEAGFDVVIGNPPYVRQELLGPVKPYLTAAYSEVHHGMADLYVYFFLQGLRLLQYGGRLSYIATNKWMRTGYGEPLRAYLSDHNLVREVVDFGHAPIFPDADVFPSILLLQKDHGSAETEDQSDSVAVVAVPRRALEGIDLGQFAANHRYAVSRGRLDRDAWSIEPETVERLLDKVRRVGIPLRAFTGTKPYYGVKTGLNDAFLVDDQTRQRLLQSDPASDELLKPYLRGQDVKRWTPDWQGLWMVFTRRGVRIDNYPAIKHHLERFRDRLEPRPPGWGGSWTGRKAGSYKWYEIQDAVDYWPLFDKPKILFADIAWRSEFAFDRRGYVPNNTLYFIPSDSAWLAVVLNSSLLWAFFWRKATHGKDDALRLLGDFIERVPIAPPTDAILAQVEPTVERLSQINVQCQTTLGNLHQWLRVEFGIESVGQRLAGPTSLAEGEFIDEVRGRRARKLGRLTPAAIGELRSAYQSEVVPLQRLAVEAMRLEQRLDSLVCEAYSLAPEEIDALWQTAPPRMPVPAPGSQNAGTG